MDQLQGFTIRVYGLLTNETGELLILSENIRGKLYNKFPGGGLELGEGLKDALIREFKEELDIDIEVKDHVYTTDCFIRSAFRPELQVIAVYYSVITKQNITILDPDIVEAMWVPVNTASRDLLSLETDRSAFELFCFAKKKPLQGY